MHEFEQSSARELKIDDHDFHLYLSKNQQAVQQPTLEAPANNQAAPVTAASDKPAPDNHHHIKAPLVGTVYLQAKPKQPPYVTVGQHIHQGDVVCVVEAMKMMTEIKSDVDGVVASVDVDNGELVECDQSLFTITEAK